MSNHQGDAKAIVITGNIVSHQRPGTSGVMLRQQTQNNPTMGLRAGLNKQLNTQGGLHIIS